MGTIKLYNYTTSKVGTQFLIKEHPGLESFISKGRTVSVKKVNVERYFTGLGLNYLDYTKIAYGPVFGMDDPRNGFIYEHNSTGDLIRVGEDELPVYYEQSIAIMGDLVSILKTDTTTIPKEAICDAAGMINLQDKLTNQDEYVRLIRNEWQPDESFLIIE